MAGSLLESTGGSVFESAEAPDGIGKDRRHIGRTGTAAEASLQSDGDLFPAEIR